ncbi:uncharacterized protein PG986_009615 [Apiospora aurea]|uniref:Uncharacterized protein n=1 Tax=Apiospora aurea TaxID=335848 RepID=A0ABR1Q872_9PEZI
MAPETHSKQKPGIAAETKGTTTSFLSAMSLGIAVHEFSHILDAMVEPQQLRSQSPSRSLGWARRPACACVAITPEMA